MDLRRRYDKLTDDINRALTRAKSTSNVLGFKRSQFDQNYYGVLFPSTSSRFIEKIRTKYSKSDSNLEEAAKALKRKPAPLCLQEPELLEDLPGHRPHQGPKSSSSSCAAEHHNLQYYRNHRNKILFGDNSSSNYQIVKRSSTADLNASTSKRQHNFPFLSNSDENLGYGFNHCYFNENNVNMSKINSSTFGDDKVELRNKNKNVQEGRPSSLGFQSFLKFLSGNRSSTSSDIFGEKSSSNELIKHKEELNNNNIDGNIRQSFRYSESPAKSSSSGTTTSTSSPVTLELGSSTELCSSSSTSCDSLFSIATTGFSFVPVDIYQPDGNTSNTQKQLPIQPITDSYRKRLKQRESIRDIDISKDLTLRKKYKLYSTDTLKTTQPKKSKNIQSSKAVPSTSKQQPELVYYQPKPRRTVSDSSKDIKAGAFVHVKGKRKAPPPPSPSSAQSSAAVSPRSTYGRRKKRLAPPPPVSQETSNNSNQLSNTSLLEDKDIRAIIEGTRFSFNFDTKTTNCSNSNRENPVETQNTQSMPKLSTSLDQPVNNAAEKLTEEQKKILIESVVNAQKSERMINDSEPTPSTSITNVPSFLMDKNVLTMDKGVYKFCKPEKNDQTLEIPEDVERPVTPVSPLSPRPWYKRPVNSHKDYSIMSFKKDIFSKTIDRRKQKNKIEEDLPDVPYCRNSLLENGNKLNIFLRLRENQNAENNQNKQEKRRSGIGIPNISELDREAAEILGQNTSSKCVEKLVNRQKEINRLDSVENEHEQSPPRSAKDLISKFEAQTSAALGKVSVNPLFSYETNKSSKKTDTASPIMRSKFKHDKLSPSAKHNTNNVDSIFKSWKCPYCTLENPSWKIVCLACEKLKPCDSVQKYFGPSNKLTKSENPDKKSNTSETSTKNEWEIKREKVLKYFKSSKSPKGSNSSLNQENYSLKTDVNEKKLHTLSKSASETSMFSNEIQNRSRKSSSPNRGTVGSPALGLRRLVLEKNREKSVENPNTDGENSKVTQISIKYSVTELKTQENIKLEKIENAYEQIPNEFTPSNQNDSKEEISFTSDVLNAVLKKSSDLSSLNSKKEITVSKTDVPLNSDDLRHFNLKDNFNQLISKSEIQMTHEKLPNDTSKNINREQCNSTGNKQNLNTDISSIDKFSDKEHLKDVNPNDHLEIKYKDTVFARKEVFVDNQAYIAPNSSNKDLSLITEKLIDIKCNDTNNGTSINKKSSGQVLPSQKESSSQDNIPVQEKNSKQKLSLEQVPVKTKETIEAEAKKRQLSNREELEREKARLREMIREMNARALADKYPVLEKKSVEISVSSPTMKTNKENADKDFQTNNSEEQLKLGAIKKIFGKKSEKVSSSVQTSGILKKHDQEDIMLPTTIENISNDQPINDKVNNDHCNKLVSANITSKKEEEKVEKAKFRRQFRSHKGLDNFKASLNFPPKSMNRTNTLVINKLLRSLENAIAEGEFDQAANYAMELAKMKVALSVTRQKDRPLSSAIMNDHEIQNIIVNMYVEDKETSKGPIHVSVNPLWTVLKLKEKIFSDFNLPIKKQRWIFFEKLADDDTKTLYDYRVTEKDADIYLYLVDTVEQENKSAKDAKINEIKTSLNKTMELQKALDNFEAEVAKSPPPRRKHFSPQLKPKNYEKDFTPADTNILNVSDTEDDKKTAMKSETTTKNKLESTATTSTNKKIENDLEKIEDPHAWTCKICTLVNHHAGAECAACTHPRNRVQEWPADVRKSEARRFLGNLLDPTTEINPVPKPQRGKSTTVQDTPNSSANGSLQPQTNIVMTALVNQPNPNITKSKYRGVDNYNPNAPYVFPTIAEVLNSNMPIIKTVMLKNPDKFVEPVAPQAPEIPPLPAIMPKQQNTKTNSNRRKKKPAPLPPGHQDTSNRKSKTYLELLDLDNAGIVPNVEPFECTICFVEYKEGEGVVLRDCLHTFCKECLSYAIQYCEESEVICPYKDTEYSCESVLQDREIRAIVSPEVYEKHLVKSVRLAENKIENAFHCMTPNCRGWCIYEDNVNTFRCPVCRILNCLTCRAIHDGLNCKQYQERLKNNCDNNVEAKRTIDFLQEMVKKGEAMNCPTCQVIVMKKWGCDWLKCSICKTEICWITRGPRWGPGGKGDTSAGCKCGVNGKKCHEKCNYCH